MAIHVSGAEQVGSISNESTLPRSVTVFVALTTVVAAFLGGYIATSGELGATPDWRAFVAFFVLIVAAERLDVRFRLHGQVESLNLSEAILAPLIFAFAGPYVMALVFVAHLTAGAVRRNDAIKTLFNASQWSVAAGVGSWVYGTISDTGRFDATTMVAILSAMVAVGVVNQLALTTVLRLAQRRTVRNVIGNLSPVIVPGWVVGWALNTLVGLLFVLGYATSAWAVTLFWVPLLVLHAAYRGYAGMESDRMRLAGLHRASRLLATRGDLDKAMAGFLTELCRCFEANVAQLWLIRDGDTVVYSVRNANAGTYVREIHDEDAAGLDALILGLDETTRVRSNDDTELSTALRTQGWRDCLVTPLPNDDLPGVLIVFDQNGLEGFDEGEYGVLEALARETTGNLEKSKLFAAIVQERHRLSQFVDTTYDGVLTLSSQGIVRAWNPGWEQITGYSAYAIVGRRLSETIVLFDFDGREIALDRWADSDVRLPRQVHLVDRQGSSHWLECTYRSEVSDDGNETVLSVVAHDVTDMREIEQLREDVDRLSQLEAVQRSKVLALQESLQPTMPEVEQAEFGVYYQPSDINVPTGGDFYDWQILPSGDVHIAVVDVLGHGIEATNDAFATIHTLRTLAVQGVPVEDLVREADQLLNSINPELVVTVICARYKPTSGELRLAGGGHPPPMLVKPSGEVEEISVSGVPVGWPGAGSDGAVDLVLRTDDTLVLYTDGLVEAQRDIIAGLKALADNASQARELAAPALARALVERSLEGAARRDDSLAMVIRHSSKFTTFANTGFGVRCDADAREVANVRHDFSAWLASSGIPESEVDDLVLALTELTSNAVKVANRYFEVRAVVMGTGLVIEVEDDGPGFAFDELRPAPAGLAAESGRGLMMVRALVDEISVRSTGSGCVVRVRTEVMNAAPQEPYVEEVEPAGRSRG
jgi:PAS domain S-box-containing protein